MGHLNQGIDPSAIVLFPQEPPGDADIWFDRVGQPAYVRAGGVWYKAHHHCTTNHPEFVIRLLCVKGPPPDGLK